MVEVAAKTGLVGFFDILGYQRLSTRGWWRRQSCIRDSPTSHSAD